MSVHDGILLKGNAVVRLYDSFVLPFYKSSTLSKVYLREITHTSTPHFDWVSDIAVWQFRPHQGSYLFGSPPLTLFYSVWWMDLIIYFFYGICL